MKLKEAEIDKRTAQAGLGDALAQSYGETEDCQQV